MKLAPTLALAGAAAFALMGTAGRVALLRMVEDAEHRAFDIILVEHIDRLACFVTGLFRSRAALHAEILVLRHQLNVLRRKSPRRLVFSNIDRLVFAGLMA